MRDSHSKLIPSVFGDRAPAFKQPHLEIIARLEAATEGSRELNLLVNHDVTGTPLKNCGNATRYTESTDHARTLFPKSVTNFHLFSFGGHGRKDVAGDCWGCQVHDMAQLIGAARAARRVKRLKIPFEVLAQPRVVLERAIAEQFCDFGTTHAATPALAVCITALKVLCGRTVDDDLWPDDITAPPANVAPHKDTGDTPDES